MKWIDFKKEQPKVEGRYVVKTITTMGNHHKLDAICHINKGKVHFGVSNQIVTHWLNEDE